MGRKRTSPEDKKAAKLAKLLPEEFRDNCASASTEELYGLITKAAINTVNLQVAKEFDQDLVRLIEQKKIAEETYKEGAKINKAKISFLIARLKERGEDVGSPEDFLRAVANQDVSEVS